jgi:hypothetical protein
VYEIISYVYDIYFTQLCLDHDKRDQSSLGGTSWIQSHFQSKHGNIITRLSVLQYIYSSVGVSVTTPDMYADLEVLLRGLGWL